MERYNESELKRIPDVLITQLLEIYSYIENGGLWPTQLTHWMLIALPKTDVQPVDWTMLRPISVAGLLYRIWSLMRTAQFLKQCKTFKVPLVAPNLSTWAIWYFIADKLDHDFGMGLRPCGILLDIVKCFNIVQRSMVTAALLRLGFDRNVVSAWMQRTVLVDSHVYGRSTPCTGLPEGDPMSIVGMYCLTYWFRNFVLDSAPSGLPIGYADNWETFHDLCVFLPVNPGKCWSWSLGPSQRKSLKGLMWNGQQLPG